MGSIARLLLRGSLCGVLFACLMLQPISAKNKPADPVGRLPHFCIDATLAHTLLLSYSEPNAEQAVGSYMLDWVTGSRVRITPVAFDRCNRANGLLYGHALNAPTTPDSPALLFSSRDPQPRVIAHTPSHLASDGSLQVYALGRALWASPDGGRFWQQRRLPTNGPLFGMTVAPADGRALYLLAGAAPTNGTATTYTIFFSPDAGASWTQRATGTLLDRNQAPTLTITAPECVATPITTILITTSGDSSGRYSIATTYISTDGGRSLRAVAISGAYLYGGSVLQTRTGLVRLSGAVGSEGSVHLERSINGGADWVTLALPFAVRMQPLPSVFLYQAFGLPDALFLSDNREALWFSADGAQSWQLLKQASDFVDAAGFMPFSAVLIENGQAVVQALPDPGSPLLQPALNLNVPGGRFFAETQHNVSRVFQRAWERNGGLAQFGYPRTEPLRELNPADGRIYLVQYFERNRFEYHPEFVGTDNEVQFGLLGNDLAAARRSAGEQPFQPATNPMRTGVAFFPQTRHTLAGVFQSYWARHGAARLYGYPISEPFEEVDTVTGMRFVVQYFERSRFEYHPERAGRPGEVQLGLLGNQILRAKGWE